MKNMKKKSILIFAFFALFLTAFGTELSAREPNLGKLISGTAPIADPADRFAIGTEIDFSSVDALSPEERRDLVLGKLAEEKARELGSRRKYLKMRGKAQLAGKGFEEYTIRTVQKRLPRGMRVESTAILGSPHDPADLILTKNGKVVEKFQMKMGEQTTYAALKNPKYTGQKILIPRDTLKKIQRDLARGKYSPQKAEILRNAIADGRLTDSIAGIQVPSSRKTFHWSQMQLRNQWKEMFNAKGLPKHMDLPNELHAAHGGKVLFVKSLGILDDLAKPLVIFDLLRGGQIFYSTHMAYHAGILDRDLAQLKVLIGSVQLAVGTVGTVAILLPNPASIVIGGAVLIVSLGVEAALWIVDKIQERRIRNQHEMICRLQENERPYALHQLLIRQIP